MLNVNNSNSGKIRKIVLLAVIMAFIALQCVFIYGILSVINSSSSAMVAPSIQRDATEEVFVKKYLELVKDCKPAFPESLYLKNKKTFDYPAILAANMETVENRIIKLLDPDQNDTIGVILKDSRVLFGEEYSLWIVRSISGLLREYAMKKIASGETKKAISAVNSMFSLSILALRGLGGMKLVMTHLTADLIMSYSIKTMDDVLNSKIGISSEDYAKFYSRLQYQSKLFSDYFDCLSDETSGNLFYMSSFYSSNDYRGYATSVTNMYVMKFIVASMETYYGRVAEHYQRYMSKAISLRATPYRELIKKLAELSKPYDKINQATIYLYAILNSETNPVVFQVIPDFEKFYYHHAYSKMKMNAGLIRLILREKTAAGIKTPANIESISSIPELKAHPELFNDYFSESKLRVIESPTGEVIIYSVGTDGKDDGGKFTRAENPQSAKAYRVNPGSFADIDCQDIKL